MEYRFYFLGPDCRIIGAQEFEAESDEHALALARQLFRASPLPHHGYELWQNRRRIHTECC